ncbi:MAG: putative periplasmic serine endoprotease DegP-like precursor [Deltaproteobacteria bacterium ADurb.Bin510]|nr:MAG: putative periplasmic serine endoprotease DegP-like precursor [Deltaproteobacteria bacterium ADurb.Bin510]
MPSLKGLFMELKPVVVNIRTTRVVNRQEMLKRLMPQGESNPFEDFFERFYNGQPGSVPERSLGSGFVISPDGYILTNNHVIDGADEIIVGFSDKEEYRAQVVGRDQNTDIALIKIDPGLKRLPYAVLGNSDRLEIGDWLIAIGNPFGFGHTLTQGVVSAKDRVIGAGPYDDFIQTDAAINPGNSGGPLFDMAGQVVGINTAIVSSGQGIGFAIPINMVKGLLEELRTTGVVTRGWLGVSIQELTPELAKAMGLKSSQGALVNEVFAGDPAAKAGILPGDVIIKAGGLTMLVGSLKPGANVKLTIWRSGGAHDFNLKLERRAEERLAGRSASPEAEGAADRLGLKVAGLTPELAAQLGTGDLKGVLVLETDAKVAADTVRKGDVIRELNRVAVDSVAAYRRELTRLKAGEPVLLRIAREGRTLFVAVEAR